MVSRLSKRDASRSSTLAQSANSSTSRGPSPLSQFAERIVPIPSGVLRLSKALAMKSSNKVLEIAASVTKAAFDHSRKYTRLRLEEYSRYQFAIVCNGDLAADPNESLKACLRRLLGAGISFDIVYPSDPSNPDIHKFVVVMLHMAPAAMEEMSHTLQLQRWLNSGCQGLPNQGTNSAKLDYNEKIQCGMMVLEQAGIHEGMDGIVAVLALPCLQFQTRLIEAHLRQLSWFRIKRWVMSRFHSKVAAEPSLSAELTEDHSYDVGYDYFIFELRRHFGEVVAFHYAFAVHFFKWLLFLAFIAFFIEIASYGVMDVRTHAISVTVFGLAVTSIWIPIVIRTWQRKCAELSVYWNTNNINERAYLNPFHSNAKNIPTMASRIHRRMPSALMTLPPSSITWIYVLPLYVILFLLQFIIILAGTSLFISAHVSIRATPICSSSSSFFCFTHITRWIASSAVSILTGILMSTFQIRAKSIAVWLARIENHRLEYEYYTSSIQKTFWMQWITLYSWFITLSFLFVAFGDRLNPFLQNNVLSFLVFKTDNQPLDLFEMLVSPVLASLSFNFIFGTFLPFAEYVGRLKKIRKTLSQPIELQEMDGHTRDLANTFAGKLRTELNNPIGVCCPLRQTTYSDVLRMVKLPERLGHKDYDDIFVCFGLIASFSAVSPIIILIVCVNALFEVHSGMMKILFGYRRPQPRRARNAGPWENYLYVCMVLGGLISVGQICFSTGHLDAFLPSCFLSDGYTPDQKCIPGSYRIVVALLLEHLVLITQALTLSMINRQPKWIATRLYKIKRLKHKFFRDLKLSLSSVHENMEFRQ